MQPEIHIYDEIGPEYYGLINAKSVIDALPKSGDVTVRMNSPGGCVVEGLAIYNALVRHPGSVSIEIDALAASIASVIAMAGDTISIAENAQLMIHMPWSVTAGTAADHRGQADILDTFSDVLAKSYSARSGMTIAAVAAAMEAKTWYTADEAFSAGLVDLVSQPLKIGARMRPDQFENAPADMVRRAAARVDPPRSTAAAKRRIAAAQLTVVL